MRWGILSTGTIAKNFAQTAGQMLDVQMQAAFADEVRAAGREALVRGMEDGSVRRDLDLEMVYLNLVNLLTGGVNFRILIDEATQMKIIRSSAEILLYYVKNSGR